jgi:RNA polymerase sigma factor (sigma-70 family)
VLDERDKRAVLSANDPTLRLLIEASSDADREQAIERLIVREAQPIIDGILARSRSDTVRSEDLDDISSDVQLRLIRRLQSVPAAESNAISSFGDFVARLTYNAVNDVLRNRFPQRTRLKNRIRYVLERDDRFMTWSSDAGLIAGLRGWGRRTDVVAAPRLTKQEAGAAMFARHDVAAALEAVFRKFGRPVRFDDLVRMFIDLWDVADDQPSQTPEQKAASNPLIDFETREDMTALWREIRSLPPRQRVALLLNLRDADGYNAVILFVLVGTARFDQIAAALEMSSQQLAAIWNDLPLDDLKIAEMLGVTRQQVINLRKSARERLARRMRR